MNDIAKVLNITMLVMVLATVAIIVIGLIKEVL